MTCTVLATGLAEAVFKDEQGGEGFDLSAGLFGPHVSMWLRDVASQISPKEPKQIRNLRILSGKRIQTTVRRFLS